VSQDFKKHNFWNFVLSDIGSIKTVQTIAPKYTFLNIKFILNSVVYEKPKGL
jgi:hypothetical protein